MSHELVEADSTMTEARHGGAHKVGREPSRAFDPCAGVLLVDKPSGISSAKVVSIARRALGIKRIGHAGTLDPLATGLLVLLVGGATPLAAYAEAGLKEYEIEIELGRRTTTDDIEGETIEQKPVSVTVDQVAAALLASRGEISQVPPQVSAIKVDGERAYDRARRGEVTELKARTVTIHSIELLSSALPRVRARVVCSKGTYMRSLARDLGAQLGCGGCISAIRRTRSSPFSVLNATMIDAITREHVRSWESLFPNADEVVCDEALTRQLMNGNATALLRTDFAARTRDSTENQFAVYRAKEESRPLGLLVFRDGRWSIAVNVAHP